MKLIVFCGLIGLIWADTTQDAFENMKNALVDIDTASKLCAPMTTFHKTLQDFTRTHRNVYSSKGGELVGQLTTMLLNVDSDYAQVAVSVNGVCSESEPLLEAYVSMFDAYSQDMAEGQKEILEGVLQTATTKIGQAERALLQTFTHFDAAYHLLEDLIVQLTTDFDQGSDFFKSEVDAAKAEAMLNLTTTTPTSKVPQRVIVSDAEIIAKLNQKFTEIKQFYVNMKNQMSEAVHLDFLSLDSKLNTDIEAVRTSSGLVTANGVFASNSAIPVIKSSIDGFLNQCKAFRASTSIKGN